MKAVTIITSQITTPTIQVGARPSRQLAMKYCPQRCSTMKMKSACTLQKWTLLTNRPSPVTCHHWGPKKARITPLNITQAKDAMVATPKT